MTVEELMSLLGEFDPEAEVRIASATARAAEYEIRDVDVPDDAESFDLIYVVAGREVG